MNRSLCFGLWGRWRQKTDKQTSCHWLKMKRTFFFPICSAVAWLFSKRGQYGGAFTWETVEMWPDADKVDFLRHLDDLTEDHCWSPLIGIRYSWANEALNLLISLDPSPDHSGLFCFLSSWCTTADTRMHAYYSINDTHGSSPRSLWWYYFKRHVPNPKNLTMIHKMWRHNNIWLPFSDHLYLILVVSLLTLQRV